MRKYQSRPHKDFSTKGKPFWQKVLVVFTNMITLWECRKCRQRIPHHPTKGHRMSYGGNDTCKHCVDMAEIDRKHANRMAELEAELQAIRDMSARKCAAIRAGTYVEGDPQWQTK